MLEQERQFYAEHLEWLAEYPGKIVLIKGHELIGVFDTIEDALAEGARRFALEPFLVRRVQEKQDEINIPVMAFG